jgi:hypothetical protein
VFSIVHLFSMPVITFLLTFVDIIWRLFSNSSSL